MTTNEVFALIMLGGAIFLYWRSYVILQEAKRIIHDIREELK